MRKTDDTISSGGSIVVHCEITGVRWQVWELEKIYYEFLIFHLWNLESGIWNLFLTTSGSLRYFSSRHRSSEYEVISQKSSRSIRASMISQGQVMRNSSLIIRAWDTTLEQEIFSRQHTSYRLNMDEYSLKINHFSWNSQGYDDIRVRQSSPLLSERAYSPGIPISRKYSLDTIMVKKIESSQKERKK